ncbi:hypothetical protein CR513_15374, partial [Mucuna pruriens]
MRLTIAESCGGMVPLRLFICRNKARWNLAAEVAARELNQFQRFHGAELLRDSTFVSVVVTEIQMPQNLQALELRVALRYAAEEIVSGELEVFEFLQLDEFFRKRSRESVVVGVEDLEFGHRKSDFAWERAVEEVVRDIEELEVSEGGELRGEYAGEIVLREGEVLQFV